ncbi:DNA primase [Croceicoccus naphthovorans]|uniref:DNA primase n=1 Tax=Croceicoccus naphthovorans TaxID=1348774 RepID=A0A0G3XF03_9SPHN|nr:DNA primase [Croceicoccus naphthovorans]AKM09782.1 DNA primase [Croceicoccus naphthovorans]MBB3990668.1 DNA primase [Croceicoccus naphthovorans]
MALSPQWLDELRTRITLSGVIGRTTRLTKAGREWKACCPFHNEKTPSFTVNDEKGFYHCFGCGAHGDAIRWMTEQRGMPFMDAVKELAAEAGMEVPAPDPRMAKAAEQRASLHDVMAAAQAWFVDQLAGPAGAQARAYLERRGVSAATIREFGFGYAPDSRGAIAEALSGFPKEMLIEAGLLISVEGKDPYDRFRGRLMLPIQDRRGRVIAFGGRILADVPNAPKYLNSPDTPVFDKGRTLYNLHRAAAASRGSDRIVVVEGYMDVIALAAAGMGEAVAPMGTALTENQLELIWKLVPVPVLCFDGDSAGQRAAMRAITRALPMLRPGHSLSIVTLPEGLDPDDLIRRDGTSAMESVLAKGESLVDAIWRVEHAAAPLRTPEDKAGLKERLIQHTETIQHPDIRSLYRRELLDRYGAFAFPKREERAPFKSGKFDRRPLFQQRTAPSPRLRQLNPAAARARLIAAVLTGLTRHPAALEAEVDRLAGLHPDDLDQSRLLDAMLEFAETRKFLPTADRKALEPAEIAAILAKRGLALPDRDAIGGMKFAFLTDCTSEPEATRELVQAIDLLVEKPAIEAALAQATARFAEDPDGSWAEQQRLLKRKLEFERRLVQMAASRADAAA